MAETKNIYLAHEFRGRITQEQPIPAGVYDSEDPHLSGLGEYLLDNGLAVYTDKPVPESETNPILEDHQERIRKEHERLTGRVLAETALIDPAVLEAETADDLPVEDVKPDSHPVLKRGRPARQ